MCVYEEIVPGLFRIEIPLPQSPLKYLNSYVIKSHERNLVIDTGLKRPECLAAMTHGLEKIGIDRAETDFLITHLHTDHFGLIADLMTGSSRAYLNHNDAGTAASWSGFGWMMDYGRRHGIPGEKLNGIMSAHPEIKYGSDWVPPFTLLEDGQVLTYGDFRFRCVETPGHTVGHTCLYEAERKILISGDHILIDISPNIQCWSDDQNPLGAYIKSLQKVYDMEVELVLPGHRRLFSNHRARIQELFSHHYKRLTEIMGLLGTGAMSAYELTAKMAWDIKASSWERFPIVQQWFATGETLAHLRFLEEEGLVTRETGAAKVGFRFSGRTENACPQRALTTLLFKN